MAVEASLKDENWLEIAGEPAGELSSKLRQRVLSRIAAGKFASEDIEYIQKLQLRLPHASSNISDKDLEDLRRLCQLWEVKLQTPSFTSHRPYVGRIIVAAKRMLFPIVRVFFKDTFDQQRQFNAQLVCTLTKIFNKCGPAAEHQKGRREECLPS